MSGKWAIPAGKTQFRDWIEVEFQPIPMAVIMVSMQMVHNKQGQMPSEKEEASQEPYPIFGPHPNTQATDFNFEKEVECLSLKVNLGDIPLEKEHQIKFIDLS